MRIVHHASTTDYCRPPAADMPQSMRHTPLVGYIGQRTIDSFRRIIRRYGA